VRKQSAGHLRVIVAGQSVVRPTSRPRRPTDRYTAQRTIALHTHLRSYDTAQQIELIRTEGDPNGPRSPTVSFAQASSLRRKHRDIGPASPRSDESPTEIARSIHPVCEAAPFVHVVPPLQGRRPLCLRRWRDGRRCSAV